MSKEDAIELKFLIKMIKELRQDMLNDKTGMASQSITCVLYAYDTLLAKVEEKVKKVA